MSEHQHDHTLPALRELQAHPQWVCWRREERRGKLTKVPYNPQTGEPARSNDPATWASYAQALFCWQQHPPTYDGIGYMFKGDITGIDLDHCIDEQGQIEPWAQEIIARLASYTERSPSGKGLHIYVRGRLPGKGIRRPVRRDAHPQQQEAAIEMYSRG